jgi:hypothetical protein
MVEVIIQYIVASIFFGHKLTANTNTGIRLISEKTVIKTLSPKQNSLSGIPSFKLYMVVKSN